MIKKLYLIADEDNPWDKRVDPGNTGGWRNNIDQGDTDGWKL